MEDPLPKLLALVLLLLAINLTCSKTEQYQSQGNTQTEIIAQAPHFVDHYSVLAVVDCMEFEESGCNPDAINWDDWHVSLDGVWIQGSKGCLQFSPYTFQEYCVDKYELKNDIFDCNIQRECAINMLNENKGHHWSTFNQCNI